jgi:hypothetical protein
MRLVRCEVSLFGFACFTMGVGMPLLITDPGDWLIGAAMALCAVVAGIEWALVTHVADERGAHP